MRLLPPALVDSGDLAAIAEAHARATSTIDDPEARGEALLGLLRLSILRQHRGRADRILVELGGLLPRTGPELHRRVSVERLRLRVRDMRTVEEAGSVREEGDRLLSACPEDDLVTRARALFCIGYSAAWSADPSSFTEAVERLSECVGLMRVLAEPELEAEALLALGYLAYPNQRLYHRAMGALERSVSLLPRGSSPYGVHLSYLAECRIIVGDLRTAADELEEAHGIGVRLGDDRLIGYAAWELARIADLEGDAASCDRWIEQARRHPGDWFETKAGNEFLCDSVLWAVRQGRGERARERFELLAGRSPRPADSQLDGPLGLIAVDSGRYAEGARRLRNHLGAGWQEPRLWHWKLLLADAELRAGDLDRATLLVGEVGHELRTLGAGDLATRFERERWLRLSSIAPQAEGAGRLRLFGPPAIVRGDTETAVPEGHPTLLVALVAVAGRTLAVDEVCDALWPDADLGTARRRLRNVMSRLRRIAPVVERVADGLRLAPDVRVDVIDFERSARSSARTAATSFDRRATLRLYRGPFVAGTDNERIAAHRRRFSALAADLRRQLIEDALTADDPSTAAADAEILLVSDPFDAETAWRVASGFARSGQGAAAHRWEERARQISRELEL